MIKINEEEEKRKGRRKVEIARVRDGGKGEKEELKRGNGTRGRKAEERKGKEYKKVVFDKINEEEGKRKRRRKVEIGGGKREIHGKKRVRDKELYVREKS